MAVYGYIRVSTRDQAEDGVSLPEQRRKIEAHCTGEDWALTQTFVERGVSGAKHLHKRPQGAALLAAIKSGDVVIATKLDRMFRDSTDALNVMNELREKGVKLILKDMGGDVTGNGISAMVFTILSAVAQFERERIAERVSDAKAHQAALGRFLGGKLPFGKKLIADHDDDGNPRGGRLVDDAELIALVSRLRTESRSCRQLTRKLAEHGHDVSHVTVGRFLRERFPIAPEAA